MQSGNSDGICFGPSGAASVVTSRKSMRGGWRKGECSKIHVIEMTMNLGDIDKEL